MNAPAGHFKSFKILIVGHQLMGYFEKQYPFVLNLGSSENLPIGIIRNMYGNLGNRTNNEGKNVCRHYYSVSGIHQQNVVHNLTLLSCFSRLVLLSHVHQRHEVKVLLLGSDLTRGCGPEVTLQLSSAYL